MELSFEFSLSSKFWELDPPFLNGMFLKCCRINMGTPLHQESSNASSFSETELFMVEVQSSEFPAGLGRDRNGSNCHNRSTERSLPPLTKTPSSLQRDQFNSEGFPLHLSITATLFLNNKFIPLELCTNARSSSTCRAQPVTKCKVIGFWSVMYILACSFSPFVRGLLAGNRSHVSMLHAYIN